MITLITYSYLVVWARSCKQVWGDMDVAQKQTVKHHEREAAAQSVDQCFDLVVFLKCTSKMDTEKKMVSTYKVPQTVLDVKQLVQQQFSVPVCVQHFTFKSQSFVDTTSLKSISLRSGDIVNISYSSDADCASIDKIIAWFYQAIVYLKEETPSVQRAVSRELFDLMRTRVLEELAKDCFGTFTDARHTANRLYFMQANGICPLIQLLTLVQRVPWSKQLIFMKCVEIQSLQVIGSICETREFGETILKFNGLECCIKSLTHKVLKRDSYVSDIDSPQSQRSDQLLEGVMIASLGALTKYVKI